MANPLVIVQPHSSNAGDGVQMTKGRLIFFDFNCRRLLPRSTPRDASRNGTFLSGERLLRRDLWARHGLSMHFLTLEFEDDQTETEYITDTMRRGKRWVEVLVLVTAVCLFALGINHLFFMEDGDGQAETDGYKWMDQSPRELGRLYLVRSGLYMAQWLQQRVDKAFVQRQFQQVQFFYSMVHAATSVWFVCVLNPQYWEAFRIDAQNTTGAETTSGSHVTEMTLFNFQIGTLAEEGITSLIVTTLIVYRMRFIYYLIFIVFIDSAYVAVGYASNPEAMNSPRYLIIMSLGLACMSYTLELLGRKDFVQSSIVWQESRRSDLLLHNILPAVIVDQLKEAGGRPICQSFSQVTVLFADVVSFTTMSAQISPKVLVALLNKMFHRIDSIAERNGVEKIKTIGDCYMAAAGLPLENPDHAKTMARFGLQMLDLVESGELRNPATNEPIQVRVGIHSGPCVAGVIGHKKFAYDIWGDAVNTAARMESHGEPMRLHCSSSSYELIKDFFVCEDRGRMNVKGKGEMQTYFVVHEKEGFKAVSFVTDGWLARSSARLEPFGDNDDALSDVSEELGESVLPHIRISRNNTNESSLSGRSSSSTNAKRNQAVVLNTASRRSSVFGASLGALGRFTRRVSCLGFESGAPLQGVTAPMVPPSPTH